MVTDRRWRTRRAVYTLKASLTGCCRIETVCFRIGVPFLCKGVNVCIRNGVVSFCQFDDTLSQTVGSKLVV